MEEQIPIKGYIQYHQFDEEYARNRKKAEDAKDHIGFLHISVENKSIKEFPDLWQLLDRIEFGVVSIFPDGVLMAYNLFDERAKKKVEDAAEEIRHYVSINHPGSSFQIVAKKTISSLDELLKEMDKQ